MTEYLFFLAVGSMFTAKVFPVSRRSDEAVTRMVDMDMLVSLTNIRSPTDILMRMSLAEGFFLKLISFMS